MFWWINKKNVNIFCADKTKLKKKNKKKTEQKKTQKNTLSGIISHGICTDYSATALFCLCNKISFFFLLNRLSFYQSDIVHISPVYKYVLIVSHLPGSEDSDAKLDTAMILEKKKIRRRKNCPETGNFLLIGRKLAGMHYLILLWKYDKMKT